MKILLINNHFYRRGGSEVVFLNTGDLLKTHGHDVVYFSQRWEENIGCENSEYFSDGFGTQSHGIVKKFKAIRNYFYNPDSAHNLENLIELVNEIKKKRNPIQNSDDCFTVFK